MTYEVVATIARGGMGVVELGRDADGHAVALKRLTLRGTADQMRSARQRLEREAELLNRLDHPAIVGLIEVQDDGGELVLVMPHLSGGTLADRVERSGPLSEKEVRRIGQVLLGALAAAHRAGVVHRDVKPGNVLFDADDNPHLADFGIATTRDVTPGLTADGLVIGTPGYLAPEQARGETATTASDVFSLGATLQYALTGEGPFGKGDPHVVIARAAKANTISIARSFDSDLRRQLNSMLEARPERRPSAAELAAGPDGTLVMPSHVTPSRWMVPAVVAATLAALLAGVALSRSGANDTEAAVGTVEVITTTTSCVALPFQPCGQSEPAPFTDGKQCIDDHADYDDNPINGCEAAPDGLPDGFELVERLEANLVPAGDVDTFVTVVKDRGQLLCDGTFKLTLTSAPATAVKLVVRDAGGSVLGEITSADGVTDELSIIEPSCGGNDSKTLTLEVTGIGSDRSALNYVITRRGSF